MQVVNHDPGARDSSPAWSSNHPQGNVSASGFDPTRRIHGPNEDRRRQVVSLENSIRGAHGSLPTIRSRPFFEIACRTSVMRPSTRLGSFEDMGYARVLRKGSKPVAVTFLDKG